MTSNIIDGNSWKIDRSPAGGLKNIQVKWQLASRIEEGRRLNVAPVLRSLLHLDSIEKWIKLSAVMLIYQEQFNGQDDRTRYS